MKLTDIRTFVVGNPPPHFGGRYFVFVKLTTDSGVSGIGEAYCVPFDPHLVAKMIEDVFARYAAGNDPHDIETLWRRVYSSGFTQHPDLTLMGVLSAIEMACWDIIGKEANQPVYKLLGGQVHERLRAYTYIYPRPGDASDVYHDPDLAAERASEYVAQGFTALARCARFVRAVCGKAARGGRQSGRPVVRHPWANDRSRRDPARQAARTL
jgi:galactonate dehydratase